MQFERHFTLEEARAELPWLRQQLTRLQEELRRMEEARIDAEPAIEHSGGNGGGPATGRYVARQVVVAELVQDIDERGIQIKDPRRGLVDFPHLRDGKEVLLCWLLGEDDIHYWHDLDSGFLGRAPL